MEEMTVNYGVNKIEFWGSSVNLKMLYNCSFSGQDVGVLL